MKIKYMGGGHYRDVQTAVKDALEPSAYSYDGQLEGLSARIEKLQKTVAYLAQLVVEHNKISTDELSNLIGYGYEVEE